MTEPSPDPATVSATVSADPGVAALRPFFAGRRALTLEDDPVLAAWMEGVLLGAGFAAVTRVDTGRAAVAAAEVAHDVLIFDRMTPDLDGAAALAAIRNADPPGPCARAPALLVTALASERHRIEGLTGGADDYVPKPVGEGELLARIAAQLRRSAWSSGGPVAPPERQVLTNGALRLDVAARTATFAGAPVALTGKEFAILSELARHVGHPVTRLMLWDRCWPEWTHQPEQWTNTIDVAMRRLRKGLQSVEAALPAAYAPLIVNVRTEGFVLRDLTGLV
jgi:two-component system OmpR family response regulator